MPRQPKDFSQAKVYKIVCNITQEIYVGSTTKQYLSQRLASHRSSFNSWKKDKGGFVASYPIFERGNYTIELIEACPCQCWDELLTREGFWIKELVCVNQRIEGRTKQEYQQDNREHLRSYIKNYNDVNKEQLKINHSAYREANRDIIKEKKKAFYQENKEQLLAKDKARYQANKEHYKAKAQAYRDAKKATQ